MKHILEILATTFLVLVIVLKNTYVEILLSMIALILSLIAIVKCRKNNTSKIFAIILLILSIVFVSIYVLGLIYFLALSPEKFMPTN